MGSKILLGLILGLFAGGSSKAVTTSIASPFEAPSNMEWLKFSAGAASIIVLIWIAYTFITYPAKFGFMAVGEVIVGAIIAGFFSHQTRIFMGVAALPVVVLAWIIL